MLGHFHVQRNKQDPGPAFQWDRVIDGARKLMSKEALAQNERMRGKAVPSAATAARRAADDGDAAGDEPQLSDRRSAASATGY